MAEPVKFTFDQSFDGGATSRYEVELENLRQEQAVAIETIKTEAVEATRAQVLGELEAASLAKLDQIAAGVDALLCERQQLEQTLKTEMAQLAYAVGRQIAGAALEAYPTSEIETVILDSLEQAVNEPRILIRTHPQCADLVRNRIEELKTRADFQGTIVLVDEESFAPEDVRVEWPNGGAERMINTVLSAVESAVRAYMGGLNQPQTGPQDPAQHDLEQ